LEVNASACETVLLTVLLRKSWNLLGALVLVNLLVGFVGSVVGSVLGAAPFGGDCSVLWTFRKPDGGIGTRLFVCGATGGVTPVTGTFGKLDIGLLVVPVLGVVRLGFVGGIMVLAGVFCKPEPGSIVVHVLGAFGLGFAGGVGVLA
jgi:hypothetical protein